MASQLRTIRLTRADTSVPWGFRLEGGVDIGHAVNIQRVTPGSVAEYAGLQAGDQVIRINNSETKWMRHDDVKMEIIRSNNDVELLIQRSVGFTNSVAQPVTVFQSGWDKPQPQTQTNVWAPKVVSSVKLLPTENQFTQSTHTNLQATPCIVDHNIGVGHNVSPTPFGQSPPMPGQTLVTKTSDGRFKKIGHSTYNSPMGLYNQKNLNQTFEQTYTAATANRSQPNQRLPTSSTTSQPTNAPASMYCGSCGGFIRGVFVRVQGRVPMHPECLKCCKCGIGLRNVGYFYIKEKLYCETHAKQAAPPPEPGMKPVVVYK